MSQESHWLITYVMANDTRITESTRDAGVPPATAEAMKKGLEEALATSLTRGGVTPLAWVRDRARGGAPTLLFTAQVLWLELERDPGEDPGPDAQRHLELVLGEDPERVRRELGGRDFKGLDA